MIWHVALAGALVAVLAGSLPAFAGGQIGKRFFPSTLAVDDPFAADELELPTVLSIKRPDPEGGPAVRETRVSGVYEKRITPDFEVFVEGEWVSLDPDGGASKTGFDNLGLGVKYQFFTSAPHETILSVGLGAAIGGTGSSSVGATSFSALEAAIGFARGLGDLPESLGWLRPLAVTGQVGAEMPLGKGSGSDPNALRWGVVLQYSIPYLESYVRDLGLPQPVRGLIPLVELDVTTPLDRGQAGRTVGTVNPGVIWVSRSFQVGVEAVIPMNGRTGSNVGIRGGISIYLDDLFPAIGRPLFGGTGEK
jgi:hypothetical protein